MDHQNSSTICRVSTERVHLGWSYWGSETWLAAQNWEFFRRYPGNSSRCRNGSAKTYTCFSFLTRPDSSHQGPMVGRRLFFLKSFVDLTCILRVSVLLRVLISLLDRKSRFSTTPQQFSTNRKHSEVPRCSSFVLLHFSRFKIQACFKSLEEWKRRSLPCGTL